MVTDAPLANGHDVTAVTLGVTGFREWTVAGASLSKRSLPLTPHSLDSALLTGHW